MSRGKPGLIILDDGFQQTGAVTWKCIDRLLAWQAPEYIPEGQNKYVVDV